MVAVDVPGFGESPPLAGGARPTVQALAEAVADFAREHVSDGPVDVGGHSMGGWIALELAKLGVARRAVAVAPAGFWTPAEALYSRGYLSLTAWLSRRHGAFTVRAFARPRSRWLFLSGQFGRLDRIPTATLARMLEALAAAPGWDDTLAAMTSDRFAGGERVTVPVTLVWGDSDLLLLPRQARRAAEELPGAELRWVRGGGHFAHWDDPEVAVPALLGR